MTLTNCRLFIAFPIFNIIEAEIIDLDMMKEGGMKVCIFAKHEYKSSKIG